MKHSSKNALHFVEDGSDRARKAIEPGIRAVVMDEYAARWKTATCWQRLGLRREIRREIRRRLAACAPPDALY